MKKNISKFIVLVMLLLVSFRLPVQAIEHDIIIRLPETKSEITTKHIECINIESTNQLDVEKNFNIVLELVDYKGKVLNYVTSEETLEGKESSEIKAYTKILPEAYKVKVFAWDNLNNKNTISNIVDIPILGGYFVEEIVSIDDLSVEVDQWSQYNLPKEVLAKFNTGAIKKFPVKWNVTSVDTSKDGSFTFEGTVKGYGEKVKINLTIKKIDVVVNPNDIVKFENSELEVIIREEIKKEKGDILKSDLLKLRDLNLAYSLYGNTNINDLRHLINLETLDLSFNGSNFNLAPLANLTKLKSLNLFGNAVANISSLQGLTSLTELNLGANNVTNIEALRNLTNLTKLKLTDNAITDYSPTKSYYDKLTEKDFKLNLSEEEDKVIKFTDINLEKAVRKAIDKEKGDIHHSDIKGLKELNVLGVGVYSLSGIENLKALEKLSLWANNIENSQLKYLKDLRNLKELDLAKNRLTYIPANAFENMSQLEELVLDENQITEIHKDAFKGLNSLKNLLIEENRISNIEAVRGLKTLESLFIRYNKIIDITPVEELSNLKDFWAGNNSISSIAHLGNLKELNWIELDNNNISDISALGNCTKVKRIKIYNNKIKNIDVVSNMKNLEWLEAENNQIENIDCVSELVNLSVLNLKKNNITKVEALRKLEKLTQLYLKENNITDFSPVAGYFNNIKQKDFELN